MGAGALDTYVLYTRRWYILFVYSLAVICQNAFWNTFGAIEPFAIIYYDTSKQMINFLSALGPMIFIPFSFVGVWYIDRFGLRKSVLTTTILCGSGALIRCIFIPHFQYNIIFPIIGQTLNNIAGPFSMILQPKISSVWFAPSERTVATSIGFQANTIGLSGCFLISMFVKHQSDVPLLLYAYAVAGIVATILAIIYFPEKPPSPPSFTGEKSTAHEDNSPTSVLKNSWACLKTRWAASLLIIFGSCPGGVYSAWGALLVNTITDLGYNNDQAEWFGFYAMIAGGVGGIIFGKLHDLYKHYKRLLIILFITNLGIFVWLSLILAKTIHGTYVTAMIANVLGGLFMGAPQGIVYEGIVELTYPMPEQTGVSVFSILFNLWSLFFFAAGDWITPTMLNWMMCGSVAVTVLALGTIRESYPRSEVDAKHEGYDRIQ